MTLWRDGKDIQDGHEPHVLAWIEAHLRPGDTFYDLGAHRGVMSGYARRFDPDGFLLCVEPNPGIFMELSSAFREDPRALLICGAAWDSWSTVVFTPANHSGCGVVGESKAKDIPYVGAVPIASSIVSVGMPLDDLVVRGVAPPPNFIKSDTQGSEVRWMKGAPSVLRSPELRSLVLECDEKLLAMNGSSEAQLLALLQDHGFKVTAREGDDLLATR